jgi:hypothetical protein
MEPREDYPEDLTKLPDRHEERMRVARRWSRWHLGDSSWADHIMGAYLYPDGAAHALKLEMDE